MTIPGVKQRTAEVLIAEIGVDMNAFPTPKHLASWAGVCPGNNESAGKRRSGKTRKGSKWLRATLTEAALAATKTKDSYLAAQYQRLRGRRGHSKAVTAVGHSILTAAWHMLHTGELYNDLGGDYFTRQNPDQITKRLVRQLQALGHEVTLEPRDRPEEPCRPERKRSPCLRPREAGRRRAGPRRSWSARGSLRRWMLGSRRGCPATIPASS